MVNNVRIPYTFAGRRKGDIGYVVADNSKILKTLIWAFAIMLVLQGIYIILQGSLKLFRKYY